MTRRVLVTGATGFLGSALTDEFGRPGHEVHALACSSTLLAYLSVQTGIDA